MGEWIRLLIFITFDRVMKISRPVWPLRMHARVMRSHFSTQLYLWWAHHMLGQLAVLSEGTVQPGRQAIAPDVESHMESFVEKTKQVITYRTCAVFGQKVPARSAFEESVYSADVVRPDRLHVRQQVGQDYDEWITIGDATWETLALMLSGLGAGSTGSHRSPVNRRLLIDRFPEILHGKRPSKAQFCHYVAWEFLHLKWDQVDADVVSRLIGWDDEKKKHDLVAWMDVWLWDDDRLAKVQIFWKEEVNSTKTFEFAQTFAM
jgi:hypothetical protein